MSRLGVIILWVASMAVFAGTVIYGAEHPEARALGTQTGSVFYSVVAMMSLIMVVALGFVVFASFFVQMLVSRYGVDEIVKRTGVPPSFLLWTELRKEFEESARKRAQMNDFFRRK